MSFENSEADRRLANLIRVGVIADVDLVNALATVDLGEVITDWLPWLTHRAGGDRTWWAPDAGEQVIVLSPSGELAQGVILPGIYQDDHPQNGNTANIHRTTYSDGSVVEYDRAVHRLTVTVGTGSVVVNCATATVNAATSTTLNTPETFCKGKLTVDGLITGSGGLAISGGSGAAVQGNITSTGGDIKADTISLKGHHHTEQGDGASTSAAQA